MIDRDVELALLRQEHRIIVILRNTWDVRNSLDGDKKSAVHASFVTTLVPKILLGTGIGVVSLFALYTSWVANTLTAEQNRLLDSDRIASHLPHLYIESTPYLIHVPATGSSENIQFSADAENHEFEEETILKTSIIISLRLVNLGGGLARDLRANVIFDREAIGNYFERSCPEISTAYYADGKHIREVQIENKRIYNGQNVVESYGSGIVDGPLSNYLLPIERDQEELYIDLQREYSALYGAYLWCNLNSKDDIEDFLFPSIIVEITYKDIEHKVHFANFDIRIKEGLQLYSFETASWTQEIEIMADGFQ